MKIKQEDLNEFLDVCGLKSLKLSNTDYKNLKELYEVLQPFAEITDLAQGDNYVTLSMVIPSVYLLLDHLKNYSMQLQSNSHMKKFINELESMLKERFQGTFYIKFLIYDYNVNTYYKRNHPFDRKD